MEAEDRVSSRLEAHIEAGIEVRAAAPETGWKVARDRSRFDDHFHGSSFCECREPGSSPRTTSVPAS